MDDRQPTPTPRPPPSGRVGVARWMPILAARPRTAADLRSDLLAGFAVGLLAVPQGMAYAMLAGLPPHYGLWATLLPMVVGALLGHCAHLNTGPVAMTALLTATVLTPFAQPGSERYIALAALLALLVGVIRIAVSLVRLSRLVAFLSHPVVIGFTAAGGLLIASTQIGPLLGVATDPGQHVLLRALQALWSIPSAPWMALALGGGTIACVLACRRWLPWLPGILPAALIGILLAWLLGDRLGAQVVGTIPPGLPPFGLPPLPELADVRALIPGALLVTVIGFLEVLTVANASAARTRERPDLDRDMLGQGAASIAAACASSFPVSGSLSRSALTMSAGGKTAWSAVVAAGVVLVILLGAGPALELLPVPVLAAGVVLAAVLLVDPMAFVRLWRIHPHDGAAALATAVITLAAAPHVELGILAGAVLAIGLFLRRTSRPRAVVLGRNPAGQWRDADRFRLATDPAVCLLRFDRSLIFTNAAAVTEAAHQALRRHAGLRWLVLVGDGVNEIDASGLEALRRLDLDLQQNGVGLACCHLKGPVRDAFERSGLARQLGDRWQFADEDAAMAALPGRMPPGRLPG